MSRVLYILSLGIILYLLYNSFLQVEVAVSKNNTFTTVQKEEVDAVQNMDTVKQFAKNHLNTIRRVHRKYSNNAIINIGLLILAFIIQVLLFRKVNNNLK